MIQQSDIEKIERYGKGLSTEKEKQYVHSLFSDNEENEGFEQYIKKEFEDYFVNNPDEKHHLSYLLDRIHHAIRLNEKQKKDTVVRKLYRWYSVAAAVLLIPILVAAGLWFSNLHQRLYEVNQTYVASTIVAPQGSRVSFSLPDGTVGWLNSGSWLEYKLPFEHNRQVAVSGEAWFHVAHDTHHPFEVASGSSMVKVLGTKFNLNAYPNQELVEVVLEEGKVKFYAPGLVSGVEMKPNERLVFSKGAISIDVADASKYAGWKEGKLIFRGDPMGEVAKRIERWYNVEVSLVDKKLEEYVFRGTFQDDTLEEVLRYLSMTSPIRYRIVNRKVLDDGTIQKTKVLLYNKQK